MDYREGFSVTQGPYKRETRPERKGNVGVGGGSQGGRYCTVGFGGGDDKPRTADSMKKPAKAKKEIFPSSLQKEYSPIDPFRTSRTVR